MSTSDKNDYILKIQNQYKTHYGKVFGVLHKIISKHSVDPSNLGMTFNFISFLEYNRKYINPVFLSDITFLDHIFSYYNNYSCLMLSKDNVKNISEMFTPNISGAILLKIKKNPYNESSLEHLYDKCNIYYKNIVANVFDSIFGDNINSSNGINNITNSTEIISSIKEKLNNPIIETLIKIILAVKYKRYLHESSFFNDMPLDYMMIKLSLQDEYNLKIFLKGFNYNFTQAMNNDELKTDLNKLRSLYGSYNVLDDFYKVVKNSRELV